MREATMLEKIRSGLEADAIKHNLNDRIVLTVCKHWDCPIVIHRIGRESIRLDVDFFDVVSAIKKEMKPIWKMLKQETWEKEVDRCVQKVLYEIHKEAAKTTKPGVGR